MKRWHRILALGLGLALVNLVTQIVVRANFSAGLYPPDAVIAIPIIVTLELSVVLGAWLVVLAVFSRLDAVRAYFARGGARSDLVVAALGVLYLAPVVFALGGITYWAMPGHYTITAAYGALFLILLALGWDDVRTLRAIERAPRARTAPLEAPLRAVHAGLWYVIGLALLLYALPYVHNLGCLEVPFSTGYDLALLYLGLPAGLVALFGGRWLGPKLRLSSARAGTLLAGAALFFWIVFLGQSYVLLANALLSPQRPLLYEGVIVDKFRSGFRDNSHILRVKLASAKREVISMEVSEYEFSRLQVGDRVAKSTMLGALGIPYTARCRWLPFARRGGT